MVFIVHTLDAAESVNRIIDFFQPHEQSQARAMLAGTLKAVVSQRLVRTADQSNRVAVCEILRMTGRARDMVLDQNQTDRLREVIAEGEYYGMQTFDQALLHHVKAGRVAMDDAIQAASSPHDFKLLVAGDGRTATSMDDLARGGRTDEAPAPPLPRLRRSGNRARSRPRRRPAATPRRLPTGAPRRRLLASSASRRTVTAYNYTVQSSIARAAPLSGGRQPGTSVVKHCANMGIRCLPTTRVRSAARLTSCAESGRSW